MSFIRVRSGDGNNADDGSSWALAKATLAGALAIAVGGDIILLSQAHAETQATAMTLTSAGTVSSPIWIICVDDAVESPIALATTATVTTTATSAINFNGSFHAEGIFFSAGTGSGTSDMNQCNSTGTPSIQTWKNCKFGLGGTATASRININVNSTSLGVAHRNIWNNCYVKFGNVSQRIRPKGWFEWNGGGIDPTSAAITNMFFLSNGHGPIAFIRNVDFANASSSLVMFTGPNGCGRIILDGSKPPASWSGTLTGGLSGHPGIRIEAYGFTLSDTAHESWITDLGSGDIVSETTIVRTNGANDGQVPITWKMMANAGANYPLGGLISSPIYCWSKTQGVPINAKIHVMRDSLTPITNAKMWVRVRYLGTAGGPLGVEVADVKATILTTAADQPASAAAWTTTGLTNPLPQELDVTFTPEAIGRYGIEVVFADPSGTAYVCQLADVT